MGFDGWKRRKKEVQMAGLARGKAQRGCMAGPSTEQEAGSWKLEAGSWKPEAGSRKQSRMALKARLRKLLFMFRFFLSTPYYGTSLLR